MTRREFLAATAATASLNAAPPRSKMGIVVHSFNVHRTKGALELLEFSHSLGAGGIQTLIKPEEATPVRKRAEELGMYIESMARIPRTSDTSGFERTVLAAKDVGAPLMRTACLGGRRYESFSTLGDWKAWVAETKAAIARAVPIVEKHKITLAIENHKDWTGEDQLALFREYESEYVGGTLDTGNNVALLDDPMELAEALVPYAAATHIKDMAIEPYEDGFLLAEVPLGEGYMDMKKIAEMVRSKRPNTRFSLEMITRDPLKIPCLTDKYWATFPNRSGRHLASMLASVRTHGRKIKGVAGMDNAARGRFEIDNVKQCLHYARTEMGP